MHKAWVGLLTLKTNLFLTVSRWSILCCCVFAKSQEVRFFYFQLSSVCLHCREEIKDNQKYYFIVVNSSRLLVEVVQVDLQGFVVDVGRDSDLKTVINVSVRKQL